MKRYIFLLISLCTFLADVTAQEHGGAGTTPAMVVPSITMVLLLSSVLSVIVFFVMYTICVKGAKLFLPRHEGLRSQVSALEKELQKQKKATEKLERDIQALRAQQSVPAQVRPQGGLGIGNMPQATQPSQQSAAPQPTQQMLYFSVPTGENALGQASMSREIGKSVYQLTTTDGMNGTFVVIPDSDATATALLSLSQVLKPVCRVNANRGGIPRTIRTLEEGMAVCEGNTWRVTRKALIELQG